MQHLTIENILEQNAESSRRFIEEMSRFGDEKVAATPPDGWSAAQIAEHVLLVETGILRICKRLLGDAATAAGRETLAPSAAFLNGLPMFASTKLEAPEMVRPTGQRPLSESLSRLEANVAKFAELADRFRTGDLNATFPHQYMGDLTAVDWLLLASGHKDRHLAQAKRLTAASAQ